MSTRHVKTRRGASATLATLVALVAVGCSNVVGGTPVAESRPAYNGPARAAGEMAPAAALRQGTHVTIGVGSDAATCQIAWFLVERGATSKSKRHALTAGHCSLGEDDAVSARNEAGDVVEVGRVERNLNTEGVADAAVISLNSAIPVEDVSGLKELNFSAAEIDAGTWSKSAPEGEVVCWTLNTAWDFDCGTVGAPTKTGFKTASYTNPHAEWDALMAGTPVMAPMGRAVTPVGLISSIDGEGRLIVVGVSDILDNLTAMTLSLKRTV